MEEIQPLQTMKTWNVGIKNPGKILLFQSMDEDPNWVNWPIRRWVMSMAPFFVCVCVCVCPSTPNHEAT